MPTKINTSLNKQRDLVEVEVITTLRGLKEEKIKFLTSDIISIVQEQFYKDIESIEVLQNSMVSNTSEKNLKGKWIFRIKPQKELKIMTIDEVEEQVREVEDILREEDKLQKEARGGDGNGVLEDSVHRESGKLISSTSIKEMKKGMKKSKE
jgi:hypothetical protein